jgi:hypothetical protein
MKKIVTACVFTCLTITAGTQILYNNGAIIEVTTGGVLFINGGFTNNTGSLQNNGTVTVKGAVVNNQPMLTPYNGVLRFDGTAAQTLDGTAGFFADNVEINNPLGVTLNTSLRVAGSVSFVNGIITTSSALTPVTFTSTGSYSGATNASHVNGVVIKEGTGAFTYPIGNGTNLQPILVNASANSGGIAVNYLAANAGTGTFTTGGTDAVPLVSYNIQEYWNIVPVGTATGSVTLYWDGYNDLYSNPLSQRRVAHKLGASWLNEGGSTTGTTASGSVTSNSISTWTSFSLGSVSVPLPLSWLAVSAGLNNQGYAVVSWKVLEDGVKTYEIQKQIAGTFVTIGTINSKGNGENLYQFTENIALKESSLYRIKQVDENGRTTFSSVMQLHAPGVKGLLTVFPNPVKTTTTISVSSDYLDKRAWLIDANGKVLDNLIIKQTSFSIDLTRYQTGTYYLKTADGGVIRMTRL